MFLQKVIAKPNMIQNGKAWTHRTVDVCGACPVDRISNQGTNQIQNGFSMGVLEI